ncbi:MAG: tyrosine-protein phosphatase, partial [Anaeroplasmataceae bacterium]|nr:tyrosine-protein phosphatase [Anaeroplasmataceae bacterium]
TRSLSDLVNKEGRHIKKHLLIRSDALNKIDAYDEKILKEQYHLKRVIDLRCDNEAKNSPDIPMQGVELCLNPVLPSERVGVSKKGNDEDDFRDFIEAIYKNGANSSISFMTKVYEELVTKEFSLHAYHQFLMTLLKGVSGATLWHCSAGKDRAGLATILVLYLLDFDLDVIIEDYLNTNTYYQDSINQFALRCGEDYRDVLCTIFGVRREYIDVIFHAIQKNYGDFDTFIEQGLHFSKEDKKALKEYYLEEM